MISNQSFSKFRPSGAIFDLSISNLAWHEDVSSKMYPWLASVGCKGIELAPSKVWASWPDVDPRSVKDFRQRLLSEGLVVSGLQSLFFSRPELQVLNQDDWAAARSLLAKTIRTCSYLGASRLVFGSPKNRKKGPLSTIEAQERFVDFLAPLLGLLEDTGIVLAIEPNAPAYGADFLTSYAEVCTFTSLLNSPFVGPQIDTGCLEMVRDDPTVAMHRRTPVHVHFSAPNLEFPDNIEFAEAFRRGLWEDSYSGWLVLEVLCPNGEWSVSPNDLLWFFQFFEKSECDF